MPDDLSSVLAGKRSSLGNATAGTFTLTACALRDRLSVTAEVAESALAAVDAVLKLVDELTGDEAPSSAYEEDRSWLCAEIGARFRSAVLAALTGEGKADG